jgi:hypothetical protein
MEKRKDFSRKGMVAHAFNHSHKGGRNGRITVQSQSGKKLVRPYLKKQAVAEHQWLMLAVLAT